MTTFTIQPKSKTRLDELLRKELPVLTKLEISNSKIRRLIMAGCIRVNGKEVRIPSYTVFQVLKSKPLSIQKKCFTKNKRTTFSLK